MQKPTSPEAVWGHPGEKESQSDDPSNLSVLLQLTLLPPGEKLTTHQPLSPYLGPWESHWKGNWDEGQSHSGMGKEHRAGRWKTCGLARFHSG